MAIDNPDNWHLKKFDSGEIFGPVHFSKILEWAGTAQVAPQDMVSDDGEIWTKAPMIADLKMDWIVNLEDDYYYGPTTIGTLLEFSQNGEIGKDTTIINCCTGEEQRFGDCAFYPPEETDEDFLARSPTKGVIRLSLQRRIRELEMNLLEKRRQLDVAAETIHRLESRVHELEARLREISGFGRVT